MAGPWLKIECSTPDKPQVLAITAAMGWDDPDLTLGKLFKLWRWFDQHTVDGNAHGVSAALLDRYVGVSGFVSAVASVGWLSISEAGISLFNFDDHNGESAKKRAQTAKRVAEHKARSIGEMPESHSTNAGSVSDALPRGRGRDRSNNPPTPQRGEPAEPAGFLDFWASWPRSQRKGGKAKCLAVWRRAKLEAEAASIVAHVRAMALMPDWRKDNGAFIPAPEVYLNGRRWDGAELGSRATATPWQGAL